MNLPQTATPVIGIVVGSGANGGGDGVVAVTGAANPVLAVADAAPKPTPQRGGNYSNHVSVTQSLLQVIPNSQVIDVCICTDVLSQTLRDPDFNLRYMGSEPVELEVLPRPVPELNCTLARRYLVKLGRIHIYNNTCYFGRCSLQMIFFQNHLNE